MLQLKIIAFGLLTFFACVTCTTIGHYAVWWGWGYVVAIVSALFAGAVACAGEEL